MTQNRNKHSHKIQRSRSNHSPKTTTPNYVSNTISKPTFISNTSNIPFNPNTTSKQTCIPNKPSRFLSSKTTLGSIAPAQLTNPTDPRFYDHNRKCTYPQLSTASDTVSKENCRRKHSSNDESRKSTAPKKISVSDYKSRKNISKISVSENANNNCAPPSTTVTWSPPSTIVTCSPPSAIVTSIPISIGPAESTHQKTISSMPKCRKKTSTPLRQYPDFLPFLQDENYQPDAVVVDINQVNIFPGKNMIIRCRCKYFSMQVIIIRISEINRNFSFQAALNFVSS